MAKANKIIPEAVPKKKPRQLLKEAEEAGHKIIIVEAKIDDGFCNYKYQIDQGPQKDFSHQVDGKDAGIVKDSLQEAFTALNVHMAWIDDIFRYAGITVEDINSMANDELTLLYTPNKFRIHGRDENAAVAIEGKKLLSTGTRVDVKLPKTLYDEFSSYKWKNELKEAVDKLCYEILLYHYGNYTPVAEDIEDDKTQLKISDMKTEDASQASGTPNIDFEAGKV